MDIPIFPTDEAPQPRENVRIQDITITPYPDRFRVHVHLRVTPFLERPNLLLVAHDANDQVISELNVIETMHSDMEFTLHLRGVTDPQGAYTLTVELFYETRNPPLDRQVAAFVIPAAHEQEES
jgi:hypothetical protein